MYLDILSPDICPHRDAYPSRSFQLVAWSVVMCVESPAASTQSQVDIGVRVHTLIYEYFNVSLNFVREKQYEVIYILLIKRFYMPRHSVYIIMSILSLLGLCQTQHSNTSKNTKAISNCCYAPLGYVGTTLSHKLLT